jgi:signal transduction histidine kinase/ActR/RegA family two-component response regulator
MTVRLMSVAIDSELDVVAARQRARQIGALCGFGCLDQARLATATSELARNVYNYARTGSVDFAIAGETAPQLLVIRIVDNGPGIAQLDQILAGHYTSDTGLGIGIQGARKLVDQCDIASQAGRGTTITLKKLLPQQAPLITPALIERISAALAAQPPDLSLAETQQQNRELLATLAELKIRQDELLKLTGELEDTNRGVVALYAELDEKADHLRHADAMKTRFLSNMSHEFRTPLSSILALAKLLLGRVDGPLTAEQEKQVQFIVKSTLSLSELVDDLLDLAKIEAGKVEVRAAPFAVHDLFSGLRGMLKPLLVGSKVELLIDEPNGPLVLCTDEAKLSQILRNFISNALKFTEAGTVRVGVRLSADAQTAIFSVSDTGIGIARDKHQLIFEEFTQVENSLQHRVKGTGLGLPLCRRLATLLGGTVSLESAPGKGSVFSVALPCQLAPTAVPAPEQRAAADSARADPRPAVLVVEDDPATMLVYESFFRHSDFCLVPARTLWEADQAWGASPPAAVVLDLYLHGTDSWRWLSELKASSTRRDVPVIIASEIEDRHKAFALGADAYFVKPFDGDELMTKIGLLCSARGQPAHQSAH